MAVKYKTDQGWVDVSVGGGSVKVEQDALGIYINDTALQDATESQDGLMTKEHVKKLNETDPNALPKTGGAMTGYLSDKNSSQVRNITIADAKPQDSQGVDGDIWVTPGEASGGSGGGKSWVKIETPPASFFVTSEYSSTTLDALKNPVLCVYSQNNISSASTILVPNQKFYKYSIGAVGSRTNLGVLVCKIKQTASSPDPIFAWDLSNLQFIEILSVNDMDMMDVNGSFNYYEYK